MEHLTLLQAGHDGEEESADKGLAVASRSDAERERVEEPECHGGAAPTRRLNQPR